ncbi:MAG: beta-glucosidase BglX [Elusimicrobiales bacterium]
MKIIAVLYAVALAALPACASQDIESRIDDILSKMTLEEKLGQMQQLDGNYDSGAATPEVMGLARKGLIGSTLNVRGAKNTNELQRAAMESRLKIPMIFGFDVIHGYKTVFPVPLAEASTFSPKIVEEDSAVAAREARSSGVHWTFAPMMDIARDPRWGRIVEGSGEDPYLGSAMARARVRGFQGKDYSAPDKIAACAKHWAAYGAAEAGRDYNTVDMSERTLRQVYLRPFKAAVDEGIATFMGGFDSLNGIPASANEWLTRGILKGEWKFDGFVVSDYTSVKELICHGIAADDADAARVALNGGMDMEMVSKVYNENGVALVKDKLVAKKDIDDAVRRILRVKMRAGLFDKPYVDESLEKTEILSPENRGAAYRSAVASFVLLKNDKNTLPIPSGVKKMLLAGDLADDTTSTIASWCGDGVPSDAITVLRGLVARAARAGVEIKYVRGAGPYVSKDDDIAAAAAAAKDADFILAVVGENADMTGEATSRSDISLPGRQLELVQALAAAGKPMAVVLMNGRPVEINWLTANVPAILEIWYPGTMGGTAVADVLFGDKSPGGKLPVSWPRALGQVPIYYNHLNTGRPIPLDKPDEKYASRYLDIPNTPLYPFGYGLSYSRFAISDLAVSASTIPLNGTVTVTASVQNMGDRSADEVVQLYIRQPVASVSRPVRELKGFERVTLAPAEKKTVKFTLGPDELAYYGKDMKFSVEPGIFKVWVSNSSEDGLEGQFLVAK